MCSHLQALPFVCVLCVCVKRRVSWRTTVLPEITLTILLRCPEQTERKFHLLTDQCLLNKLATITFLVIARTDLIISTSKAHLMIALQCNDYVYRWANLQFRSRALNLDFFTIRPTTRSSCSVKIANTTKGRQKFHVSWHRNSCLPTDDLWISQSENVSSQDGGRLGGSSFPSDLRKDKDVCKILHATKRHKPVLPMIRFLQTTSWRGQKSYTNAVHKTGRATSERVDCFRDFHTTHR